MVQMRRTLIALGGILLASAAESEVACGLNSVEVVDELLNSAVYIWAAVERCEHSDEGVRCVVNVASATESINGMINVIVKALEHCGHLKTTHALCGAAVGRLTESVAGLTAASGGIVAVCPNALEPKHLHTVGQSLHAGGKYGHERFGECVVDIKSAMSSLVKAIKRMMTITEHCEDRSSEHCAHNSLKIVDAFASLAEMIASSIHHCTVCKPLDAACKKMQEDAECAAESTRLVDELDNVGRAAVAMEAECEIGTSERLYLDDEDESIPNGSSKSSSTVTLALVALLPITAVLAFSGGSRIARARSVTAVGAPVEFEALITCEPTED